MKVTYKERIVLEFLERNDVATAQVIGAYILEQIPNNASRHLMTLGASICGHLRRVGWVEKDYVLNAWKITESGRKILNVNNSL